PSGRIKKSAASILGTLAFAIGSFLAYQVNMTAFYVSLAIVLMCLLYNGRSEEHTSELQSRENLVCRLLLEKKNNQKRKEETRHLTSEIGAMADHTIVHAQHPHCDMY